eukprot:7378429-Prymnesium_polylepis.1
MASVACAMQVAISGVKMRVGALQVVLGVSSRNKQSHPKVERQAPGSWHPRGQPASSIDHRCTLTDEAPGINSEQGARSPVDLERRSRLNQGFRGGRAGRRRR